MLGSAAGAAGTADGVLLVTYTTATSLQVTLGDGTPVRAGSVVPAGVYSVQVKDDPNTGDQSPGFIVNGPGVNVTSNLDSSGMGIDGLSQFGPVTLQPSSSYRIGDTDLSSAVITFTTSATATAGGGTTTTPAITVTTSGGTSTTAGTSSGSTSTALAGTLQASVAASGKVTLTMAGKAVKSLRPGRWKVTVSDHSRTSGFILGKGSKAVLSLKVAAAHGSRTVTLTAGKWFVAASAKGPKTAFSVTSA
jgi:hypothetical protein